MGGSDTIFAWDPSHFHGTSIQEYLPSSNIVSKSYQLGLVRITPNCIAGLWEKYAKEQVTLEELREGVLGDEVHDD